MKTARSAIGLTKHQVKTEATLRSVLDASERVFVRDGYERAQIETIAAEAGRTKGAIYAHFRSKEDIFFALLERKAKGRRDEFLRALPKGKISSSGWLSSRSSFLERYKMKTGPFLCWSSNFSPCATKLLCSGCGIYTSLSMRIWAGLSYPAEVSRRIKPKKEISSLYPSCEVFPVSSSWKSYSIPA
jgi:AcrR family transcriptional regulator